MTMTPLGEAGGGTTAMVVDEAVERYPTDVTPDVLTMRRYRQFATMLSLGQIGEMLAAPGVVDSDALVRFSYARFTTVVINMLVLLMSLPFYLLREPASLLRSSVLCAATAIPATMGALLAFAMDLPGIAPAVEVFLPVLVLLPVTVYMVTMIRT